MVSNDPYTPYEKGLQKLLTMIDPHHDVYSDVLVYQQRLLENIGKARQYGDNEGLKSERSEIIHRLNEVTLSALRMSFTDISRTKQDTTASLSNYKASQKNIHGTTYTSSHNNHDKRQERPIAIINDVSGYIFEFYADSMSCRYRDDIEIAGYSIKFRVIKSIDVDLSSNDASVIYLTIILTNGRVIRGKTYAHFRINGSSDLGGVDKILREIKRIEFFW